MDSKTINVIIIIVLTVLFVVVPVIMKKVVWKKLLTQLNNEQYDKFYKTLDLLHVSYRIRHLTVNICV